MVDNKKNDKSILNPKNRFSNCSNYKDQPKREQTFRPLGRLVWSAAVPLALRDLKYRLSACSTLIYLPDVVLWAGLVGVFTNTEGRLNPHRMGSIQQWISHGIAKILPPGRYRQCLSFSCIPRTNHLEKTRHHPSSLDCL